MMVRAIRCAALLLLMPLWMSAAPNEPMTIVACAPGYPGTTVEAKNAMESFASNLARAAGWPNGSLHAVYFPGESEGLARIGKPDVAVVLTPSPFFLAHRDELGLKARLSVQTQSGGLAERWTLVAKKGRVKTAGDLSTMTLSSIAGYAPSFVRGALSKWGRIPDTTKIEMSLQVLSTLRKAATSSDHAVLLDGAQADSLHTLPFAKELEVVARSDPMPSALVATVGKRIADKRWAELEKALLTMSSDPKGIEALSTIRMVRFAPLDTSAFDAATAAWSAGKGPAR